MVDQTVKDLTDALTLAIHTGAFFGILSSAGKRMKNIHKLGVHSAEMLRNYLECGTDDEGYLMKKFDLSADELAELNDYCLLYTSPSPRDS